MTDRQIKIAAVKGVVSFWLVLALCSLVFCTLASGLKYISDIGHPYISFGLFFGILATIGSICMYLEIEKDLRKKND